MRKAELISKKLSLAMAFVLFATQMYAVVGGPDLPDPGRAGMTREQQIQLGAQTAAQVYKQMPVLPDSSPVTQYIQRLGAKLVQQIPQEYSWPYQFHVIAQKEINAFALPGGPIFINLGTITAADNEAELAGVMSHEMSHVYMQHSAKQAGKTNWIAGIAGLAGAVLGSGGFIGQLAAAGIQMGANGVIMKYSRTDEAQADAVGAIIMYKAGYNPEALAQFFQKLAEEGGSGPQWLSDHPNPGNRQEAIQKEIANWPPKRYDTDNASFVQAKQQAEGLKGYTAQQIAQGAKSGEWASLNQRNGAIFRPPAGVAVSQPVSASTGAIASNPVSLQSVLPSSRLVTTNLGPVSIARPDNWQVISPGQNGGDVMIAPRAGLTRNAVGYGVAINAVSAQGHGLSLDQITEDLVRNFQGQGNMQALGDPQPITVGGVQGRSVTMQSTSPFPDDQGRPQKERDWLVTVPRSDGSAVYMVFVAPQSQFDRFRPTFENMLKSVRF
ncbi:MAG: M48 family metalloprotease [Candidatus Korobacteraceae bacterium]